MKYKKETSAGGVVYKREGDQLLWLVTQHSQNKGWGFPKGLVGDIVRNEPMEVAAVREVREEGGVDASIVHPAPVSVNYKYQFQGYLVDKTVYYYLMEYKSGDPKDHDWEMMDAKFLSEEETRKIITYKSNKEAFEKILGIYKDTTK